MGEYSSGALQKSIWESDEDSGDPILSDAGSDAFLSEDLNWVHESIHTTNLDTRLSQHSSRKRSYREQIAAAGRCSPRH